VAWACRYLFNNGFTYLLPTELGTMDTLFELCVRRPHSLRLDACTVTGLWELCRQIQGPMDAGRVQTAERRAGGLVVLQWRI
jgi:hypothetical protein